MIKKLVKKWYILIFLLPFIFSCTRQIESPEPISVIPEPEFVELHEGNFLISAKTDILIDRKTGKMGKYLSELLSPATGYKFTIRKYSDKKARRSSSITLLIDTLLIDLGDEGYSLIVSENRVLIEAGTEAGIFYGIQSFRQLLTPEIESEERVKIKYGWKIPCVSITDKPCFKWRGLMIDCSRTFWSKEFLFRTIRLMSLYKMNTLHLHLTDDQGWRLEILKYPELAERGSKFPGKYDEPPERQGFYTQYDMREIIAYAKAHNVTIVPEIEMPGHSNALLSVFPELSCTEGEFEIYPFFKGPGITEDILCAGKESTFDFLEDVLDEVVELFPGDFIHIGGDEAPKTRWEECPDCQERIKQEWLDDEAELQSYFIKRIEKYISEKNKRLIGWDEIIEGGLAPDATVMSWRGVSGGIKAARAGHDVVMSPNSHCYFDYSYERISTKKAYYYNPVPEELSAEEAVHILGAQANFWSHIDRTEAGMDKQLFPRLLSIAEITWTSGYEKDFYEFSARVIKHLPRLKNLGVNYYQDTTIVSVEPEDCREGVKMLDDPPFEANNNIYPVVFWKERIEIPRPVQLHFIRLDLESPDYEVFTIVGDDPDGEGPAEASLESPINLAKRNSAIMAVNANAFRHLPGTKTEIKSKGWFEGLSVDIAGLAITDGVIRSKTEDNRTDFWIDKKGEPNIGKMKNLVDGVQGVADWGSLLLRNGEIVIDKSEVCHPRTMIGSDKRGRYLYFVVADGRQSGYSEGISLYEAANIMKDHGCYNAINLDGGGSSIMLAEVRNELTIMNKPSGSLRPVPVMIGVRKLKIENE